jgi:hypothetical protein
VLVLVPYRCRHQLRLRVWQYAKRALHRPSWLSTRERTSLHSGAGSPLSRAASTRRPSSASHADSQVIAYRV